MKRKIAAIVAADVAGYSKLVADDEEDALRRLETSREVFDEFVSRYGGRIFNTAGDAVLAEFASAVEAVRCALEIQESLRTKNLGVPEDRQMLFRLGINIGDIVERDGDLLGDGVNIAARLQGLAKPGGICVSRAVYEQVENKLAVGFADIGLQAVKNIPNPIHAYFVDSQLGRQPRRPSPAVNTLLALLATCGVIAVGLIGALWIWLLREAPVQVAATPPEQVRPSSSVGPTPAPAAANPQPPPTPVTVPEPPKSAAVPPAEPPARPRPLASGDSGEFEVIMVCEKLPWTGGTLSQDEASVRVEAGKVSFSRLIRYPTRQSPVIGEESGKGTLASGGRLVIESGWSGSTRRSYTARYEGSMTTQGGTLRGN